MAPKKKGNKKGQDDWEADLGETIPPADQAENGADEEDGEDGSGGLMAMLRKNKQKRKEKGLPEVEAAETPEQDEAPVQVAQEATMEDEFALPEKKGKGGNKGKQAPKKATEDDDEGDGTGRVLTKAEKEKLKKEREKQRKKEQVCWQWLISSPTATSGICSTAAISNITLTGCQEEDPHPSSKGTGASQGSSSGKEGRSRASRQRTGIGGRQQEEEDSCAPCPNSEATGGNPSSSGGRTEVNGRTQSRDRGGRETGGGGDQA